jgi:hypothetical protein
MVRLPWLCRRSLVREGVLLRLGRWGTHHGRRDGGCRISLHTHERMDVWELLWLPELLLAWQEALCAVLYGLVEVYRRSRGASCLHLALMMEAASTSETSVNFQQTFRRNRPEDSHLHTRRRENLKCHCLKFLRTRLFWKLLWNEV